MKRVLTKFRGVYQLESTIKRFDGKPDLCFYYTYEGEDGKKQWVKVGWRSEGITAAYASERRQEAILAIRNGSPTPTRKKKKEKSITFGEAWGIFEEKWLPTLAQPQDEQGRYLRYIKPKFEARPMNSITTEELEEYKNKIMKKYAPATVKLILGDIRRVYKKMIEWDKYDGINPTEKLKMPKVKNQCTRFLTKKECDILLEEIKRRSELWHDIAFMSLYTGMRLSEILDLKTHHIDLENSIIHILDTKSSDRHIAMPQSVKNILIKRAAKAVNSFLFYGRGGRHLEAENANSTFSRSVKAVNLNPPNVDRRNKVTFHTLRHTFCSHLVMNGFSLYDVSVIVGHTTPAMTKRYAHLSPDNIKKAMNFADKMYHSKNTDNIIAE